MLLPEYHCKSEQFETTKNNPTNAISTIYALIFNTKTHYSCYQVMGWTDDNILKIINKGVLFFPRVCLLEQHEIFIYNIDSKLLKQFVGTTPNEVWKLFGQLQKFRGTQLFGLEDHNIQTLIRQTRIPRHTLANIEWHQFFITWMKLDITIIELEPALKIIYPRGYEFRDREYRAWQTMLRYCGCTNVTPWSYQESKVQFWTKSDNPNGDRESLANLHKIGYLTSTPSHIPNTSKTFWSCFVCVLADNEKYLDGKQRILSIIANDFSYANCKIN
ncbi:hypothetical protein C2G38_2182365 [Gigaspora rosea]|uniref:Uncharacterized protein n=1 Tax=Gigaspora rosea TaxID=44941 RepID=A0A397VBP6_9GLOM|nr:hypothetical protein C2G38_2182365 [Gigaspora rosea]